MGDPSFEAFRKQIGAAAKKKDRKALAAIVAQSFFWMGEKGDKADKKRSGDRQSRQGDPARRQGRLGLGGAAGLRHRSDRHAVPGTQGHDLRAGRSGVRRQGARRALAKATGTEEGDWAYPTQPGLEVRAAAQPNAPVVEKLGMHFVRVMEDSTRPAEQNPMLKVVTPSGKIGFVPADAISPLGNDQLCYAKEGGGWKIAGFLGGEP